MLIKLLSFILIGIAITLIIMSTIGYAEDKNETELSGSDLWAQNCGRCHNFRGPQEFNDSQWNIIVNHMRVIGGIPGNQARAIIKFLQEANNPPLVPLELETTKIDEANLADAVQKGNIEKGKEIYNRNCASCHGLYGKGDGPAAVSLRPRPRDLTDQEYVKGLSDEDLFKVITYGGSSVGKSPFMPGWGNTLSKDDIIDIITYLRSLSKTK